MKEELKEKINKTIENAHKIHLKLEDYYNNSNIDIHDYYELLGEYRCAVERLKTLQEILEVFNEKCKDIKNRLNL